MISQIRGNCTGDANPDAWYPTVPNGGRPDTILRRMVPDIKYAIEQCNSCPKKNECLEEGLKPNNLAYGIWGGLLAGERIAVADERGDDFMVDTYGRGRKTGPRSMGYIDDMHKLTQDERESAVVFAQRIKPYLEE